MELRDKCKNYQTLLQLFVSIISVFFYGFMTSLLSVSPQITHIGSGLVPSLPETNPLF